jgi:kynurenine formamidase
MILKLILRKKLEIDMYIFLSHFLDLDTPMYGGKKGLKIKKVSSIENGDSANTSQLEFSNHLGTHIDFPYHFHKNGQKSTDYPPDFWIISGKEAQILDIGLKENELLIKPCHIKNEKINKKVKFLIFKTGYEKYRYKERYWKLNPGLSIEIINWIEINLKNIKIIGIDSISVSSYQHRDIGRKVHKIILNPNNPVLLIEDMDLSKISSNTNIKNIYIAPLVVKKSDAAPCTIIAEVEKK